MFIFARYLSHTCTHHFQSDVEKVDSDILKLGLIHETFSEEMASSQTSHIWLTFAHKLFNDFFIAYYARGKSLVGNIYFKIFQLMFAGKILDGACRFHQ